MSETRATKALIILDGFGVEHSETSAIDAANTPTWDWLLSQRPNARIETSGMAVGLPEGQMGNSEVGHMNIGAGRIVYQNYTRISKAIEDGSLLQNPALCEGIDASVASGGAVHIYGLLSPGGVHSHEDHFFALADMALERGARQVYLHAILDGRDMPPRSAEPSLDKVALVEARSGGRIRLASVIGRYFTLDRDNRWDRVEVGYNLMVDGQGLFTARTGHEALEKGYAREENDEFIQATALVDEQGNPVARIEDGDTVICAQFRPDRAREISYAFTAGDEFAGFSRNRRPQLAAYVMMTEYAADMQALCAYPPEKIRNDIGEYLSKLGRTQLRISETEKYAHITFFFNGGDERVYPGEERVLVPSADVATYDLKPEMSAFEVTDELVKAIRSRRFDLIVCNFANGDMVGHTGNYEAAIKAVEVVDQCLTRVLEAMREVEGETLITADHGNVELMVNPTTGQPHTAHTTWPVALIYDGPRADKLSLQNGALCDLAPTLLELMELEAPGEMTGRSLVSFS